MKLLIVGGVARGASAAARARRLSEDAEIILFERGPDVSFANCGVPRQAQLDGHGVEQDFGESAAVVVPGAEEQDSPMPALAHRARFSSLLQLKPTTIEQC